VSRRSKYTTYPIGPLNYSRMVEAVKEGSRDLAEWRCWKRGTKGGAEGGT